MNAGTVRALEGQRRRAIGSALDAVDRADLCDADFKMLRKAILDSVNDLHRNTLLIVEAAEEGMSVNELIIDRLAGTG